MPDNLNIPTRAELFFSSKPHTVVGENLLVLYESGRISEIDRSVAKAYCRTCEMGTHRCCVQTFYGWCCDLCIEEELLALQLCGIHTVNSCCGHGDRHLAFIMTAGEDSAEKMRALGYDRTDYVPAPGYSDWAPKTTMIYELEEDAP